MMSKYHKIQTVFKRDPATNFKTLMEGEYSLPEFNYLTDNEWIWTEKVDGMNIRVYFTDDNMIFKGRTDNAQIPATLFQKFTDLFLPVVGQMPAGTCLYGEGYGPKIQKGGGNYRKDQDFVLFDVRVGDIWLQRDDVEDVANNLGLDVVPIIGGGTLSRMVDTARRGFTSNWGNFLAEGIVARPLVELNARNGGRIITKIKTKDFV